MIKKISERKVILFTAALIIISGLVRFLSYPVGLVLFYLAFLPFLIYRAKFYYDRRGVAMDQPNKYRFIVLISMAITILLNIFGIQDVEFFLVFLLMIDFLLVVNNKL